MIDPGPTIAAFVMAADNGFAIDTTELPLAVFVSPNEGNVEIHSSLVPDAFNAPDVIAGAAVQRFEVAKCGGSDAVLLWYKSDKPRCRFIGYVTDLQSAQAWVQRVNQLYVSADGQVPQPSQFALCPVINDILRTGEIRVMPGDYLNSHLEMDAIPPYIPSWQQEYVDHVVRHFRERTGYSGIITGCDIHEWLRPPAHRYPYLVSRINYTPRTFDNRITLPLELIFNAGDRADEVGIVPLGAATRFAILHASGQQLSPEITEILESNPQSLEEFLSAFIDKTRGSSRFALCSMTSTAADYLLEDCVANRQLPDGQRSSMPTIDSLAHWLFRFQDGGLLILDVGVAYQVKRRLNGEYRVTGVISRLPYPWPVQVGLAFRKDDTMWGRICHQALMDTFLGPSTKAKESMKQAGEDAASVDIDLALTSISGQ